MSAAPQTPVRRVPTQAPRVSPARTLSLAALIVAGIVVVILLLGGGSKGSYTLHARFIDAGQLVSGDLVEVGGLKVGIIDDIRLSDDNQADVVMKIDDKKWRPLHVGTTAGIGTVGLVGIANRFVELTPGPSTMPAIPDGGTLSIQKTKPIVDLDAVLNAFDPKTRRALQGLIRNSAKTLEGESRNANAALLYLNPALTQTSELTSELVRDQAALERLIRTGAVVSSALASRQTDLEGSVVNTATTLRAVAGARAQLGDLVARTPGVLRHATRTLKRGRQTLVSIRPLLRELRPSAAPLARVLRGLPPFTRLALPLVAQLRGLISPLKAALDTLPGLEKVATPAVTQTTLTLRDGLPVFAALRPYAPDLVTGISNGFGGSQANTYDANGHYARIALLEGANTAGGILSLLPFPPLPGLDGATSKNVRRCPGGATGPANDGSNPFVQSDTCDPSQGIP